MTPLRTVQYREGGELRLAVIDGGYRKAGASPGRRLDAASDFTAAIAAAREAEVSLHEHLLVLMDDATDDVLIDLREGLVHGNDGGQSPLAVPVEAPEVWAAGVTYGRSRTAREAESDTLAGEFYNRIYSAERPELFMKDAGGRRTVATGESVGVRGDSEWSVPEPELGLVLAAGGTIVGFTIGNDISARDIEGANPLYLPQAKIFARACSLGPAVLVPDPSNSPLSFELSLQIFDADGQRIFSAVTSTSEMNRSFEDLVSYAQRYNPLPDGTVLLTGTGIVPPDEVALAAGYRVEVEVSDVGTLINGVRQINQ